MNDFLNFLRTTQSAKVISNHIDYSDYVALNLSAANEMLATKNLVTAEDYENYIQNYLINNSANYI